MKPIKNLSPFVAKTFFFFKDRFTLWLRGLREEVQSPKTSSVLTDDNYKEEDIPTGELHRRLYSISD